MKFWLLLGGTLIVLGTLLFTITLASVGWDFTALDGNMYEHKTHTFGEDITNISIDTVTADINILPLDEGEPRAVCYENSKVTHTVTFDNQGNLSIVTNDQQKWYDRIFSFGRAHITLYLPTGTYANLSIDNTSGDVRVASGFTFAQMDISITTGDVSISASALTEMNISTTTGDISLRGATANTITLKTTTGDTELQDITTHDLTSHGTTGDLDMERVIATGNMYVKRGTGDVEFEACDAAYISIETTTGDIEGSLLTSKTFHTHTTTGDVRVPLGTTGGNCKLSATTGDITIHIKQ